MHFLPEQVCYLTQGQISLGRASSRVPMLQVKVLRTQMLFAVVRCRVACSHQSAWPCAVPPSQQQTITKQAIAMAASGAVLGPLCDGQHSSHGVLHYVQPAFLNVPILHGQLETCWYRNCRR